MRREKTLRRWRVRARRDEAGMEKVLEIGAMGVLSLGRGDFRCRRRDFKWYSRGVFK